MAVNRLLAATLTLVLVSGGCAGEDDGREPEIRRDRNGGSAAADPAVVDTGAALARIRAQALLAAELHRADDQAAAHHADSALAEARKAGLQALGGAAAALMPALQRLSISSGRPGALRDVRRRAGEVQRLAGQAFASLVEGGAARGLQRAVAAELIADVAARYDAALSVEGAGVEDVAAYRDAYALQAEVSRRFLDLSAELEPEEAAAVQVALGVFARATPAPDPPETVDATAEEVGRAASAALAVLR